MSEVSTLRSLPSARDAEWALLGCLVADPVRCLPKFAGRLLEGHFVEPGARVIWRAVLTLHEDRSALDPVTLLQRLTDRGWFEEIGGSKGWARFMEGSGAAIAAHDDHYWGLLQEKWLRRELIRLGTEVITGAYEADSVEAAQAALENGLLSLRKAAATGQREFAQVGPAVMAVIETLDRVVELKGHVTRGPGSGFTDLDRRLMGFGPGEFIIIAARPAMGKSAFAAQIAENICTGQGHYKQFTQGAMCVGFVSLEMSAEELMQRTVLGRAGVELNRARDGLLSNQAFQDVGAHAAMMARAPLHILSCGSLSIQDLQAQVRQLVLQHDARIIIIDYIQLMKASGPKGMSRQQELGIVSRGLKEMARDLGIVVIGLAQVGRQVEERGVASRMPQLSDLRESGDMEQDADRVLAMMRPHYYDPEEDPDYAIISILKNRHGAVGELEVKWHGARTRFDSLTSDLLSNDPERRERPDPPRGGKKWENRAVKDRSDHH